MNASQFLVCSLIAWRGSKKVTKQQYDRAYLQGTSARQVGRKQDENPYRNKPSLRTLAEAWTSGWQADDMAIRSRK